VPEPEIVVDRGRDAAMSEANDFFVWRRRHPVLAGVLVAVIGAVVAVVGIWGIATSSADSAQVDALRERGGTTVRGTFVGSETVVTKTAPGLPRRTRFCPQYAYTAADGVERTIVDRDACVSAMGQLRRTPIDILVDPDRPSQAFVDEREASIGRTTSAIFSWAMLVLGVGALLAGPVGAMRGLRRLSAGRQ